MKVLNIIRAREWWEYKFPPILIIPYVVILKSNSSVIPSISSLCFLLSSLIAGAVYVSILNDITDIEEDESAGKKNRMAKLNTFQRSVVMFALICVAFLFSWFMRNNLLAVTMYIASYVSFTLYSVPPFRFKKRGILGLFADASGSQMFPTLFTAAYMSVQFHYKLSITDLSLIAIWSLCFGLRGILWHQFHDLENDRRSGLRTIVQQMSSTMTKIVGRSILFLEVSALLVFLFRLGNIYFFYALIIYLAYMLYRRMKTNLEVIIVKYTTNHFDIVMNVFYQVFLPVSILIAATINNPNFAILLALHILFFHQGVLQIFKNLRY
jgi:4-hydroxybenzoate polyprenyltransferase